MLMLVLAPGTKSSGSTQSLSGGSSSTSQANLDLRSATTPMSNWSMRGNICPGTAASYGRCFGQIDLLSEVDKIGKTRQRIATAEPTLFGGQLRLSYTFAFIVCG